MTENTGEVTIGTTTYGVIADTATADEYLNADPAASNWQDAAETDGDTTRPRALVAATRAIMRLSLNVTLDLTRPELTPQPIVDAACELASAVLNGTDIVNYAATNVSQKSVKAGSVQIENFRTLASQRPSAPLPSPAWELLRPFVTGASSLSAGAIATGTWGRSGTLEPYRNTDGI